MTDILANNWKEQLDILFGVIVAGVLGGLIGFERELMDRPAGLRTHAILASAAALLVGSGHLLVDYFVGETPPELLRVDPIRIVEAIVTGVAFLGAGTIFRRGDNSAVEGLTTAASLMLVAAIGITVAMHQFLLAIGVTLMSLLMLRVLGRMFKHF